MTPSNALLAKALLLAVSLFVLRASEGYFLLTPATLVETEA